MMLLTFFLTSLLILNVIVVQGNRKETPLLGGWQDMDLKKDADKLKTLLTFALSASDPPYTNAKYKIVSAQQQVVAGIKYDILAKVTPVDQACLLINYIIVDHFGDMLLLENEKIGDCTNK